MRRPDARPGGGVLSSVADRMRDLHHPARTRILLELAGDVEALSADLRRSGMPAEEAALRAAERVVPSDAALDALVRLHRPSYRRLTAPVPDSALRRLERGILLVVTTSILVAGLFLLSGQGLLRDPSPLLWAILGLSGGVIGITLWKGFQLFIRREHRPETLGRGLWTLLALSGGALLAAGAGFITGLWMLAATLEAGVPDTAALLTAWLFRESVLLTTALLTALAGGLAWFLLAQGAAAVRGGDEEVRRTLAPMAVHDDDRR
jgi:hypothetical protein